jgi:tRNA(fMet)-specific endonuclease VapC
VTRFMLDTNTISYIARSGSAAARARLKEAQAAAQVYVSVITEGEILYGLAKRPEATQVANYMYATLDGLEVLPWTSEAAAVYGTMRAENERRGLIAGNLDMLIAAHAVAEGAVLVTNDGAIARLAGGPDTVNWTDDLRPN